MKWSVTGQISSHIDVVITRDFFSAETGSKLSLWVPWIPPCNILADPMASFEKFRLKDQRGELVRGGIGSGVRPSIFDVRRLSSVLEIPCVPPKCPETIPYHAYTYYGTSVKILKRSELSARNYRTFTKWGDTEFWDRNRQTTSKGETMLQMLKISKFRKSQNELYDIKIESNNLLPTYLYHK